MKVSSQEEYGLRILIRIASCTEAENMSIQVLSEQEGLSVAYVGKLAGVLRKAGFIYSNPGNVGGYVLAKPANEILVRDVLHEMGGLIYTEEFCRGYAGNIAFCKHNMDCSVRSLWRVIQMAIDKVLDNVTLADLTNNEHNTTMLLMSNLNPNPVRQPDLSAHDH